MTTAERRAREKARRKEEILQAARDVFFGKGFHRATVDDVAERAELSKGTIYLYFESKEEILAHLLLEGLSILLKGLESAYAPQGELSAEERIRRMAFAYLDFFKAQPNYFRLIMALDRGRFQERVPPDLYQKVLTKSMSCLEWVRLAVQQGVEEGAFASEDPWKTAGMLWASLNGVLILMAHPLRRQMLSVKLEPMFEATLELLLRGLSR